MTSVSVLSLITFSITTISSWPAVFCQYGYTTNDDKWGYSWYNNEPFRMYCNSSALPVTSSDYVTWLTPRQETLAMPFIDENYELKEWFNVEGFELFVKSVRPYTHGVYVCMVFDKENNTMKGRSIIGLNVHEIKYENLYDKYRDNVARAFIASGTLLALFLLTCTVYQCRYPRTEYLGQPKNKGTKGKGQRQRVRDQDMPYENYRLPTEEGVGGYDNPVVWTKL